MVSACLGTGTRISWPSTRGFSLKGESLMAFSISGRACATQSEHHIPCGYPSAVSLVYQIMSSHFHWSPPTLQLN